MIYLDNAATTKPDGECLKACEAYLNEKFYNPSALYAEGYALHKELEKSRANIIKNLCASEADRELIFTSCGTEADNQAVFCCGRRGNVVTTCGEHSAVYAAVNQLKSRGIEVRMAPLNSDGSVNIGKLTELIDKNTSLVSVIHVNNETGAINDVNAIARKVKEINPMAVFHSDGVQAFGKIPVRLCKDVDLYSISAHKIGALKGTGALLKRKSLSLGAYIYGGGQENGLRSGTENVFGIKMLELAASKKYRDIEENYIKVSRLNGLIRQNLSAGYFRTLSAQNASPYILSVIACGVRGEIILHEADDNGLIIGTGSACSSNSKKRYSRVILECGISEAEADGVLRISFSPDNTEAEVIKAAEILNTIVKNRREIME